MHHNNLYHQGFKALLKRAGFSGFTLLSLRRTCATLLLPKNVNPKIVQETLGQRYILLLKSDSSIYTYRIVSSWESYSGGWALFGSGYPPSNCGGYGVLDLIFATSPSHRSHCPSRISKTLMASPSLPQSQP
jgi:hypothetical protein